MAPESINKAPSSARSAARRPHGRRILVRLLPASQEGRPRMTTRIYTLPVDQTQWRIDGASSTVFNWEYDETRDRLLTLYEKGKEKQWNTNTRLDWSIAADPGSVDNSPDDYVPISGSATWGSRWATRRRERRHHTAAWI